MIYERLSTLCKEKGTSPTAVCLEITGSKGNLANWKNGIIKSSVLLSLCEFLDCSADYLLGISDIKKPATPKEERPELSEREVIIGELTEKFENMDIDALKAVMTILDRIE